MTSIGLKTVTSIPVKYGLFGKAFIKAIQNKVPSLNEPDPICIHQGLSTEKV